jgi:pimeloyl-ACP methyl ester carboxylesterase
MASNVTVVLAHGAWADGSSWSKVIAGLRAAGVDAVAAPLPLTSFADDVAALDRTLERVTGPIVLVGHAYAGAVIGATRDGKVKALVYVAALAPDEGETVADVFYRAAPHPLAPKLAPDDHGLIWLPREAFASAFAPDATVEEQAVLFAIQRPSWFLVAEHDRMIASETQDFMAQRMGATVQRSPTDHAPSVTAPASVIGLILAASAAVGRS